MKILNNYYLPPRTMERENEKENNSPSKLDLTNVFVKFLPPEIDDAGLRWLFSPFGYILSAKVMVDSTSGASLGFGYVKKFVKSPFDGICAYTSC